MVLPSQKSGDDSAKQTATLLEQLSQLDVLHPLRSTVSVHEAVALARKTVSRMVVLFPGTHYLSQTLTLGPEDSGLKLISLSRMVEILVGISFGDELAPRQKQKQKQKLAELQETLRLHHSP